MVDSRIISDFSELQRLSEILAGLTCNSGSRTFSTVLSSGSEQLLFTNSENTLLRYKICEMDKDRKVATGQELIENLVSNFKDFRHFVLLYDDPTKARKVEFNYIKNGLENGERCLYVLADDDVESSESIKNQMDSFGINTSRFTNNGSLLFWKIPDPAEDKEGFTLGSEKIIDSLPLQENKGQPVRVVAHMKDQFRTKEEIAGHAEYEGVLESNFANFPGSLLCSHYVKKYEIATHGAWIKSVFRNHGICLVMCSENSTPVVFQNSPFLPSSQSSHVVEVMNEPDSNIDWEIRNLSVSDLERDIAEIKNDIYFLESQVKADLESYTSDQLHHALGKISHFMKKEELLKSRLS